MNALKVTLSAFGQAHRFIWEEGFLKMLYVPLLLTVLYFTVMVGACYFSAAMVVEFFEGQLGLNGDYGGWAWVEWLAEIGQGKERPLSRRFLLGGLFLGLVALFLGQKEDTLD